MKTKEERRAARDEAIKAQRNWKPTPSPEESDLRAMGNEITEEIVKRPDGSPPFDPHVRNRENTRDMRPAKDNPRGKYETR
jgi:hypothetical protein